MELDSGANSGFSGAKAAYISNSTAAPYAHSYTLNSASVVHMYQDVIFPAGETNINLSFKLKVQGESSYDYLRIYLVPTSFNPAAGTLPSTTTYSTFFTRTMLGSSWTDQTITITGTQAGNSTTDSPKRILFVWRNDGSAGTQPPAAIDDITLTSSCAAPSTLSATGITAATATANWNAYSGATTYNLRYREVGSTVWLNLNGISGTSQILTGLSQTTQYEYQIKADNCVTWSSSSTFTTACGASVPFYTNNFSTFPGNCWSQASGGTPATGSTGVSNFWAADGFLNIGTTGAAKINIYGNNRIGWLKSPLFDLSAGGYQLLFNYGLTAYDSTNSGTLGNR